MSVWGLRCRALVLSISSSRARGVWCVMERNAEIIHTAVHAVSSHQYSTYSSTKNLQSRVYTVGQMIARRRFARVHLKKPLRILTQYVENGQARSVAELSCRFIAGHGDV